MSSSASARHFARRLTAMVVVAGLGATIYAAVVERVGDGVTVVPQPTSSVEAAEDAVAVGEHYDTQLDVLKRRRKHAESIAESHGRMTSSWANAAQYQLQHARMTGDYEGYIRAEESLQRAMQSAKGYVDSPNVGPLMLKAKLSYELHRFREAIAALAPMQRQAEALGNDALLAEIKSLKGASTFALGMYDEGLSLMRDAAELSGSSSHKQRIAIALEKLGLLTQALTVWDDAAEGVVEPHALAWLAFQRGRLHLEWGQYEKARPHLEQALALFPGFWLIEEHIAELDASTGHEGRAMASYRSLIERTNNPEFMDALAELVVDSDPSEAERLIARARAIYETRLVTLPDASYGHALSHFLTFDRSSARAIDIAERNKALRPDGEARTRLAQAYLKAGRTDDASRELEHVLATKWQNPETWATASVAYARLGRMEAASLARDKAIALNPHAVDDVAWLSPG